MPIKDVLISTREKDNFIYEYTWSYLIECAYFIKKNEALKNASLRDLEKENKKILEEEAYIYKVSKHIQDQKRIEEMKN